MDTFSRDDEWRLSNAWYRAHHTDLGWWALVGNPRGLKEHPDMHYAVLIQRGKSKADDFAQAIETGSMEPASVFVIGVTDTEAFASALLGEPLEIDAEFEASLALKVKYTEAIGTEDASTPLTSLIEHAKRRIEQINNAGTTRLTRSKR